MVPHPSTRHAHGCLASEIGRDPAFPTRYDRTESSCKDASPDINAATRLRSRERRVDTQCVAHPPLWWCWADTECCLPPTHRHGWTAHWICAAESCGPKPHRSYNQGLISADRSNKATLLLTIPRCLLSRLQRISRAQFVKLLCSYKACTLSAGPGKQLYGSGRSYRYSRHRAAVIVSGMDSVLEAFKHNPTDGSVSPLAAQLSENTNYLNQRFLSY